jgi:hypothetical protein
MITMDTSTMAEEIARMLDKEWAEMLAANGIESDGNEFVNAS